MSVEDGLNKYGQPICPQCAQIVARTGLQCKKRAVRGATKCKTHGGSQQLSRRGIGNPNYKHGRTSKYQEHALAGEAYLAALDDPDLLSNKHEIALIESMIQRAGSEIADVIDVKLWDRLGAELIEFRSGLRSKDTRAQMRAFTHIESIHEQGSRKSHGVENTRKMLGERNRLVFDQHRLNQAAEQTMTREQVIGFVMSVADLINRKVTRAEDRDAVQAGLMQLLGAPTQ